MNYRDISGISNKTVILRVDYNVPIANGIVTDNTRIKSSLETISYLIKNSCKVILVSHFGRPKGKVVNEFSLEPLLPELEKLLGKKVKFISTSVFELAKKDIDTDVVLLENIRFYEGEEKNDDLLAKALANLADIYVNDAFSASHRAHASIVAITKYLPSYPGKLLEAELHNLTTILTNPKKPMMAIVGGSKISTKLELLKNLIPQVDYLVIGGAMANNFLKVSGYNIGKSLYEPELLDETKILIDQAKNLILPIDVVVAAEFSDKADATIKYVSEVSDSDMILDLGPETIASIEQAIMQCKTLIWNGPLGAFELKPFASGTMNLASIIARNTETNGLISVAGGGDSVAALNQVSLTDELTYVSTAGGAFLEWLEGKVLPGVSALTV
jgi:phosphoglycerate kinase